MLRSCYQKDSLQQLLISDSLLVVVEQLFVGNVRLWPAVQKANLSDNSIHDIFFFSCSNFNWDIQAYPISAFLMYIHDFTHWVFLNLFALYAWVLLYANVQRFRELTLKNQSIICHMFQISILYLDKIMDRLFNF